ncbi:MAG TPA: hypothetical protein VFZ24_14630 [Longimicrobiales bacterium]
MVKRVPLVLVTLVSACRITPQPAAQNPSPMVEHTRAHERMAETDTVRGRRHLIDGVLSSPVRVFVPEDAPEPAPLLIHFHGAAFVPERAAAESDRKYIAVTVHLGAGSSAYQRPFADPAALTRLMAEVSRVTGRREFDAVVLSGFSAGYGAIRAILREPASAARIEGVLLLDGLHTAYVPAGRVLHQGGQLDTNLLAPFLRLARDAVAGRRRLVITHSEIFPGTFASTTETTDWIIRSLGLERSAVLEWGPAGMQQLSSVHAGALVILGFAGNSAPDHVDHFHGMPHFLRLYDAAPKR